MQSTTHSNDAAEAGISAIVDQQFDYASRILAAGLVPIMEPEVSISSPHKEQAETLLRDAIAKHVEALPEGATVMLKITIPTRPGVYGDLASDPRVLRVVALSGGYSRDEACARLARDPTLIASFSRARRCTSSRPAAEPAQVMPGARDCRRARRKHLHRGDDGISTRI